MFNTYALKMEVNSHEVVNIVRLLGSFGMKFDIGDEYCKVDDLNPQRKEWFRQFVIYGKRRELEEFDYARKLIISYHRH